MCIRLSYTICHIASIKVGSVGRILVVEILFCGKAIAVAMLRHFGKGWG